MHYWNQPSLSTTLKCAGRFLEYIMATTPTPFAEPYKNIDDLVQLLRIEIHLNI